jgi:hypothetical protein
MAWLLNVQGQAQAIGIDQQLLDTHLRDLAVQQIAYNRLVLIEDLHQLGLAIFLALHLIENRNQDLRFELKGERLLGREAQVKKDVSPCNVGGFIPGWHVSSGCVFVALRGTTALLQC